MKTTLQQEGNLKTYLSDILKYRETIDEVYDHVLSAMEEKPENIRFQDAVNQILNDDFKGGKGLVKMERQHLWDATLEGFVNMVKYVKSDFLFPNIFYTLCLFGTITYTIQNIKINYDHAIPSVPLVALLFLMFTLIRTFFVGYITGDTRRAISDVVIRRLMGSLNWFSLFPFMLFPIYKKQYQLIMTQHPSIIAGILTVYILFIIATIRISIEEFKTYKTA